MKQNTLLRLAVAAMTVIAVERAGASSAVAVDPQFHITRAYDPFASEQAARRAALDLAVHHGWLGARIVASSGRSGYCAIALAYKRVGTGAVMGVSLGKPTQAEADQRAIDSCIKAGGYIPKVYARFQG